MKEYFIKYEHGSLSVEVVETIFGDDDIKQRRYTAASSVPKFEDGLAFICAETGGPVYIPVAGKAIPVNVGVPAPAQVAS